MTADLWRLLAGLVLMAIGFLGLIAILPRCGEPEDEGRVTTGTRRRLKGQ